MILVFFKTLSVGSWWNASSGTDLRRRVVAKLKENVEKSKGRPVVSDGHVLADPVRWNELGIKRVKGVAYVSVTRTTENKLRSACYHNKGKSQEKARKNWK